MSLPQPPRELPVAVGLLFASLLYAVVWPVVVLPFPGQEQKLNPAIFLWFLAGFPAFILPWLTPVAYRGLGFVAYGSSILATASSYALLTDNWQCQWLTLFQGIGCWLIIGSAIRYLLWLSRSVGRIGPHRYVFLKTRNRIVFLIGSLLIVLTSVSMVMQFVSRDLYRSAAPWELLGVALLLLAVGWTVLFRPWFELTLEPIIWLMYSIRSGGQGHRAMPSFGPCLVIANHAAWMDPILMEKFIPRPTTYIMTARFFHLPVLKPLLKYVFKVIVVPETPLKREAPEIQAAIAALDQGCCVVMYPEGFLRRKEEVPLRRFARGVWTILSERPQTPVVSCWIEGSWGSFCSHHSGPPTKNKKLDRRRPIGIGVSHPEVLPKEILKDHLQTRIYLMNRVSAARAHLGLEPLPTFELPARGDDGDADEPGTS